MNSTNTTAATPRKLSNGSWGAVAQSAVKPGDLLQITTRSGKSWTATVARVESAGRGAWVVSTSSSRSRHTAPTNYTRTGRRTGCQCGSREDSYGDLIDSPSNCWTCNHDA